MYVLKVFRIVCLSDSTEAGNDEPYLIVFAADFNAPVPQAAATLYGPYVMGDSPTWNKTTTVDDADPAASNSIDELPFWGFDGQPRAIADPSKVLILVALCESDNDVDFSNTVRTNVQAALGGALTQYALSQMPFDTIKLRLPQDMQGFVDQFIVAHGIEADERLGDVQLVVLTQQELDDASKHDVQRVLKFKSQKHESEYDVAIRISPGVGSVASGLTAAELKHRYAAVWEKRPGPIWMGGHEMTAATYQSQFDTLTKSGYRPIDISPFGAGNEAFFAAIWEKKNSPPWVARHGMTAAAYQDEVNKGLKFGYRPTRVRGYEINGEDRYAAIWVMKPGTDWIARHGMTAAAYQDEFTKHAQQGYRLIDISGYAVGGQERYAAIWEKKRGAEWMARHAMSPADYQQEFTKQTARGFRPVRVCGYRAGNKELYAAIWEKQSGPEWIARHGLTAAEYQKQFTELVKQGYRLVNVSGYAVV